MRGRYCPCFIRGDCLVSLPIQTVITFCYERIKPRLSLFFLIHAIDRPTPSLSSLTEPDEPTGEDQGQPFSLLPVSVMVWSRTNLLKPKQRVKPRVAYWSCRAPVVEVEPRTKVQEEKFPVFPHGWASSHLYIQSLLRLK